MGLRVSLRKCFGKWKVIMDPRLKEELEGPSYPRDLRDRFYRVLKELEEDLNSYPPSNLQAAQGAYYHWRIKG